MEAPPINRKNYRSYFEILGLGERFKYYYIVTKLEVIKMMNMMKDTDAMAREREAELREAYRRTDEMVLASRVEPKNLYKTFELK